LSDPALRICTHDIPELRSENVQFNPPEQL